MGRLRYIEQELAKKRGKNVDAENQVENEVKRAEDELYKIPENLKVSDDAIFSYFIMLFSTCNALTPSIHSLLTYTLLFFLSGEEAQFRRELYSVDNRNCRSSASHRVCLFFYNVV